MNFQETLKARADAANSMQQAAHALDSALAQFQAASADIRASIMELMQQAASNAHARATAECASRGAPTSDAEINQRRHHAESAARAASADVERRYHAALEFQFTRFSAEETFAFELSRQVLEFLSQASGDAKGTDARRPPAGTFAAIVATQSQRLESIARNV